MRITMSVWLCMHASHGLTLLLSPYPPTHRSKWMYLRQCYGIDYSWGLLDQITAVTGNPPTPFLAPPSQRVTRADGAEVMTAAYPFTCHAGLENCGEDVPRDLFVFDDEVSPLALVAMRSTSFAIYLNAAYQDHFATVEEMTASMNGMPCLPLYALGHFVVKEDLVRTSLFPPCIYPPINFLG